MVAANVLPKEEFPDFDDETGILPKVDDEEGGHFLSSQNQSQSSRMVVMTYFVCQFRWNQACFD